MVRTGERCVRVAGGKSSEKKGGTSIPSPAAGPSTSRSNSAIGGNPVCPRETPSWQKPITCFFPKKEAQGQNILKKEMAESSKANIPNLETVPVVAGPSAEGDQQMPMVNTSSDNETKDEVKKVDNEESGLNTEEKEMVDEEKEVERIAKGPSSVKDIEENLLVERSENSSDPVSPAKDINLDTNNDKKDESVLTTPKSEKKLESSNDQLVLSESGSEVIAASRKRFGVDSDAAMDDNEIPAKKLKLDDVLPEAQPVELVGGCSTVTAYLDFSSVSNPNGNESDSSGFDEVTSRKRENQDSASDANTERPMKKFKVENAQPRYRINEPASVFDDIKSSSEDWSAVNDSGSEESINRKALCGVNSRGSLDGSISPSKISELDSSLLAIHIGDSTSASINEDIIVVSSDEDNSDMELDNSINFSPENPYQYTNGHSEEAFNNPVDAPPPQDEVPQGQNNPMELGYPGNNDNNDDIPDNIYYPVENGYPEDDGSLAGNNSDDDPPEESDEDDDTDDTDVDDNDDEEDDDDDEDDQDDGEVPFYANIHFYNNNIDD